MHLVFWVNENVDKDVMMINHIACDSGTVVGFRTSNDNTGNIVKLIRAHCIHVDVIFNFFLRDIMFMKNAESSAKINALEFHHIHVMLFVSTLIVGPPLVLKPGAHELPRQRCRSGAAGGARQSGAPGDNVCA